MGFSIPEEDILRYKGIVLLDLLCTREKKKDPLPVKMQYPDLLLEGVVAQLHHDKHLEKIFLGTYYQVTEKGLAVLRNTKKKLELYTEKYSLFSAVNLGQGTFAFERFFDREYSPEVDPDGCAWSAYLGLPGWEDLRVAVCIANGWNPIDMVFLQMLDEGAFDTQSSGWQGRMYSGEIFDKIIEICNTAIKVEDLAYEADGVRISGEEVLNDVMDKGKELHHRLMMQRNALFGSGGGEVPVEGDFSQSGNTVTTVTTTTVEEDFRTPLWVI